MQIALHEQSITRRFGTYRADVPGALAILCAIAFATGIFDEDVRETLAPVLWGSLGGAALFGALYHYARRGLQYRLTLARSNDELIVRIEGPSLHEEFGPGFGWKHGVFVEHVDAYVAARDAPVAWVQFRSMDGQTLTIRRALGIQHVVPRWPDGTFLEQDARVFSGDPIALHEALLVANARVSSK